LTLGSWFSKLKYVRKEFEGLEYPLGLADNEIHLNIHKLNSAMTKALLRDSNQDITLQIALSNSGVTFRTPKFTELDTIELYYEFSRHENKAFPHDLVGTFQGVQIAQLQELKRNYYNDLIAHPIISRSVPEAVKTFVETRGGTFEATRGEDFEDHQNPNKDKMIRLNYDRTFYMDETKVNKLRNYWVQITDGDVGYATLHTHKVAELIVEHDTIDQTGVPTLYFKFPNDEKEPARCFDYKVVSPVFARAYMMVEPERRTWKSETCPAIGVALENLLADYEWNGANAEGSPLEMTFFLKAPAKANANPAWYVWREKAHVDQRFKQDRRLFMYAKKTQNRIEIEASDAEGYTLVIDPGDILSNTPIKLKCCMKDEDVLWEFQRNEELDNIPFVNANILQTLYQKAKLPTEDLDHPQFGLDQVSYDAARKRGLGVLIGTDEVDVSGDIEDEEAVANAPYDYLVHALARFGRCIVNVPGDQDCQFRAAFHQLNEMDLEKDFTKVRRNAVNRLVIGARVGDESKEQYTNRILNAWGDGFTLQGIANAYRCDIIVVKHDDVFRVKTSATKIGDIVLGQYRDRHYVSTSLTKIVSVTGADAAFPSPTSAAAAADALSPGAAGSPVPFPSSFTTPTRTRAAPPSRSVSFATPGSPAAASSSGSARSAASSPDDSALAA